MSAAANQGGGFERGRWLLRQTAYAEHGFMLPLLSVEQGHAIEISPATCLGLHVKAMPGSVGRGLRFRCHLGLQYAQRTYAYAAKLVDRGRVVAGMNKLAAFLDRDILRTNYLNMKNKITGLLFLKLILISFIGRSQQASLFNCSYSDNSSKIECNLLEASASFEDYTVIKQVKKILIEVGLPQNFVLKKCTNLSNAVAFTSSDGTRYIVVDQSWLGNFGNSDWLKLSILAHEIGHHLAGHTLKKPLTLEQSRSYELEADKFSGHILKQLGATIADAQSAINSLIAGGSEDIYSTHPAKSKRLKAIQDGFNGNSNLTQTYSTEKSCEEYLSLGDDYMILSLTDKAIQSYSKALELNSNCVEALNNIGKAYNDKFNPQMALVYLNKCIQLRDDWVVRNNIGVSALLLDKVNDAISIYNNIITANLSNEANAYAYFNRAQAYAKVNYWKNACSDWYYSAYYGHPQGKSFLSQWCR